MRKRPRAAIHALAFLSALAPAAAPAQQLLSLGGVAMRVPEGGTADLVAGPQPPVGDVRPGEDAVEFRWADGRTAILVLRRGDDPLSDLPPPGVAGAFDAQGVGRIPDSWTTGRVGRAAPALRERLAALQASGGLRGYVVRTGNPDYPLARVLCGVGGGGDPACRVYSRVGEDSVLTAVLPRTDAASVARDVAAYATVVVSP